METAIVIANLLPEIISAVIALVGVALAAWQAFRARDLRKGLRLTEQTLAGLIAAVEMLPDSPERDKTKRLIKQMSLLIGTEGATLAPLVEQIVRLLNDQGILTDGDDSGGMLRASAAIQAWSAEHAK